MIRFLSSLFFVCNFSIAAPDPGVVHHPVPKKPLYLSEDLYPSIKAKIPLPPERGSSGQAADEQILRSLQKKRTEKECAEAKSEVLVSLQSFFGTAESPIPKENLARLAPFFEQLRNDGDYFIQRLKKDFPRERPFAYMKRMDPCVPKEVTGAYPSGHAALSALFSEVLTEIYPSHREYFSKRAQEIAHHRVLTSMHHPSDVEAGSQLGLIVFQQLRKSDQFRNDLQKAKLSVSQNME